MREIHIRLRDLERRAAISFSPVGVLLPTEDGKWSLSLGGKTLLFDTQTEGAEYFRDRTRGTNLKYEPVLIMWGLDEKENNYDEIDL